MNEEQDARKVVDINEGRKKKGKKKSGGEDRRDPVVATIETISHALDVFIDDAGKPSVTLKTPAGEYENSSKKTVQFPAFYLTAPIDSRVFGAHVRRVAELSGTMLKSAQVKEIKEYFEAKALTAERVVPVLPRYNFSNDVLWIDRIVGYTKVTANGIEHVKNVTDSAVRFRRSPTSLPMEECADEPATVDEWCEAFSVSREIGLTLLGWALGAMLPDIACPILCFHSEQKSAKTTKAKFLKRLIDPSTSETASVQKDIRSTAVSIFKSRMWVADNLSGITSELSDLLCRASTGGTFTVRALHTDSDENVMSLQRAVLLTGLDASGDRADLQSRLIRVTFPPIAKMRSEIVLNRNFALAVPRLQRLVLEGVMAYLKARRDGTLSEPDPDFRAAEFSIAVSAAEPAWGVTHGTIAALITGQREEVEADAAAGSPVVTHILYMLSKKGGAKGVRWSGSPSDLLTALRPTDDSKSLPKTADKLGTELLRAKPILNSLGVLVHRRRSHGMRFYELEIVEGFQSVMPQSAAAEDKFYDF